MTMYQSAYALEMDPMFVDEVANTESPEKALLVAVIHLAIKDYFGIGICNKSDQSSAKSYLFDEGDRAFGFEWACDALGIIADDIRFKLRTCPNEIRIALKTFNMARTDAGATLPEVTVTEDHLTTSGAERFLGLNRGVIQRACIRLEGPKYINISRSADHKERRMYLKSDLKAWEASEEFAQIIQRCSK